MEHEALQEKWPQAGTYCWGCGKNNKHGLKLQSFWEGEEAVATWTPQEYHLAFPGILNGGIISTLIDCHSTGVANAEGHRLEPSASPEGFMYVTASLFVKFLRPTPLGRPVTLRAKIKGIDGNRITVTCSLFSDEEKCATGEVVAVRVDSSKFLD